MTDEPGAEEEGAGREVAARPNEGRWRQMAMEVRAGASHRAGMSHLLERL